MARHSRGQSDGLEVALAIHLGIYCAAAACFALGLYALLQPSRHPNPGLSAYKPPPAMVVTYLPSVRNGRDPVPFTTVEADTAKPETAKPETAKRAQADAQKPAQEATAEAAKRQRAASVRKEKREIRAEYAAQPVFGGGSRPWF
jgi:hypothetical protein